MNYFPRFRLPGCPGGLDTGEGGHSPREQEQEKFAKSTLPRYIRTQERNSRGTFYT